MKLSDYFEANEIRSAAFARKVGVSKQTMFKYERGLCLPSISVLDRIQQATDGAVTARDFLSPAPVGAAQATSPIAA